MERFTWVFSWPSSSITSAPASERASYFTVMSRRPPDSTWRRRQHRQVYNSLLSFTVIYLMMYSEGYYSCNLIYCDVLKIMYMDILWCTEVLLSPTFLSSDTSFSGREKDWRLGPAIVCIVTMAHSLARGRLACRSKSMRVNGWSWTTVISYCPWALFHKTDSITHFWSKHTNNRIYKQVQSPNQFSQSSFPHNLILGQLHPHTQAISQFGNELE